jgi:hypothetical protein
MEALLGFHLGIWDHATFAAIFVIAIAGLVVAVFILGLALKMALDARHPRHSSLVHHSDRGVQPICPWRLHRHVPYKLYGMLPASGLGLGAAMGGVSLSSKRGAKRSVRTGPRIEVVSIKTRTALSSRSSIKR